MHSSIQKTHRFHLFLLFLFCILLYWNILHNGWHLDDFGNILNNAPLHADDLLPETLLRTFYAHPESSGTLYRPVANFTFALNWFFGQNDPFGYHLTDISIHSLTGSILYLSCLLLFSTPALTRQFHSEEQRAGIALLSAALWLCAPIHTSAVTYVVQRMAQLAALFSVSAIFFYLCIRLTISKRKQFIFFVCFFCSVLLALGSKENAVLLFPSLLLLEGIFFLQFQRFVSAAKKHRVFSLVFFILITTCFTLKAWNIIDVQSHNYGHRNFTLSERLLTQPRILLFYLSQIFYPTASRLSIAHDINLSTSLFSPWYTLLALICCLGLITFTLLQVHKRPLLSFAILYYFLNHLIESTVFSLEIIFEHRNLLPSLFIFLPIAAFFVGRIDDKRGVAPVIAIGCAAFLLQSGLATVERNKAWKNAGTLNEDAVRKAPHDARAKLNLAGWYVEQKMFKEAVALCEQAEQLSGREASVNTAVPIALNLKGTIAYEQGNTEKAAEYFRKAYALRKDYTAVAERLIATLIELKCYDEAIVIIAERNIQKPDPKLLLLKASILLRQKKSFESIAVYRQARKYYPDLPLITAGQAKALMIMGYHNRAAKLLDWAARQNEPVAKLLQIENLLLTGMNRQAPPPLLNRLIQTTPLVTLLDNLELFRKDAFQIPVETQLLRQAVLDTSALLFSQMKKETM